MSNSGGSSGGSTAGALIVRHFPFAFNTPSLLTGATIYTPTAGDILLDAWLEIDTAWNGTTPFFDFGTFVGGGFLANGYQGNSGAISMLQADTLSGGSGLLVGHASDAFAITTVTNIVSGSFTVAGANLVSAASPTGIRSLPGKFHDATPIKVVVSQDGTDTGADPGSTQGAAVLYLVTSTPT